MPPIISKRNKIWWDGSFDNYLNSVSLMLGDDLVTQSCLATAVEDMVRRIRRASSTVNLPARCEFDGFYQDMQFEEALPFQ